MAKEILKKNILNILKKHGISESSSLKITNEIIFLIESSEKTHTHKEICAYIDGGSRGNPGIGASAVIIYSDRRKIFEGGKFFTSTTNNEAEYNALLIALKESIRLEVESINVFTDSELLANQINGIYSIKSPSLKKIYLEVKKIINKFNKFNISHIPREKNREADRLANFIMDTRNNLNINNNE